MELITPRLKIREFRWNDLDALVEMDSDPRVSRYEPGGLTAEQIRYRLEGALEWARETPRTIFKLAITLPPEERAWGRLSLKMNQANIREWEIGWTLHPQVWGKGYASEAARALLAYAFTQLNAHRVVAFCHAENAASHRVMEKIGMTREGHLRETIFLNGVWADELVYSILERDFQAPRE
ncbi:MAG: GNAT family N-acetyltransferase [Anaerolineaceae bacterium]|nr:GNAT family N-acetyltransferase [Anaerolineaceae bacterium]